MHRIGLLVCCSLFVATACRHGARGSEYDDPATVDAGDPADDGGAHDSGTSDGAPSDGGGSDAAPSDASSTACDEARSHSDFAWIQTHVFTPSCATSGCHVGTDAAVGLRLDEGEAYNNLVNKTSSTKSGWTRVVPGSPSSSYLVVALGRAEGPPPVDGFMPLGAPPLCTEMHEAIERWIAAGAPR